MAVPEYVILLVIAVTMFVAISVTALITVGVLRADITAEARQRFTLQICATLALWITAALGLSFSGALIPRENAFPILGVLIIFGTVAGNLLLFRSATAKSVLRAVPPHWLATIQTYRVIGVIFLLLMADGLLPRYFAWTTGWGDILVGVAAPFVGYLLWRDTPRFAPVGLVWCAIGIADLLLVLWKAVRSAPGPLQTVIYDPPTEIIGYFPFPMIPLVIVPISLILHVQLIRALISQAKTTRPLTTRLS
ncbi:MAG: hypothetical protein AAF601_01070 [Pseudomonadota bacterium]